MAILKGVWKFNATLSGWIPFTQPINFVSNGETFDEINYNYDATNNGFASLDYDLKEVYTSDNGWVYEAYRIVDFGETGKEFNPGNTTYQWFKENATYIDDPLYSIKKSTLVAIADSIRSKTGKTDLIKPENMPSEIAGISNPALQEKTVTENGEVIPDAGFDGLSKVIVDVKSSGIKPITAAVSVADVSISAMNAKLPIITTNITVEVTE